MKIGSGRVGYLADPQVGLKGHVVSLGLDRLPQRGRKGWTVSTPRTEWRTSRCANADLLTNRRTNNKWDTLKKVKGEGRGAESQQQHDHPAEDGDGKGGKQCCKAKEAK